MRYFPLFHDTQGLSILLVGGGEVAARKVSLWAKTQAQITLVAPQIVPAIGSLVAHKRIVYLSQPYHSDLLRAKQGVIAATDDPKLNRQISEQAKALGLWVNVVDDPSCCSVITPAIIDRAPIVVAIGSEGSAPVLVRSLRALLEGVLPTTLGQLAEFIGTQRQRVMAEHTQPRQVWQRFLQRNGLRWDQSSAAHLVQAEHDQPEQGKLWLIETEQDPKRLPIAALSVLQNLDAIYAENQLDEALNRYCRRDAQRQVYVDCDEIAMRVAQGEQLLLVAPKRELQRYQASLVTVVQGRFVLGQLV